MVNTRETIIYVTEEVVGNWQEPYPGAREELPHNRLTPKGKKVWITFNVDTDHTHNQVTRWSVTSILLLVNNTSIKWYSKRQNTVQTVIYGAELTALKIAVELIPSLMKEQIKSNATIRVLYIVHYYHLAACWRRSTMLSSSKRNSHCYHGQGQPYYRYREWPSQLMGLFVGSTLSQHWLSIIGIVTILIVGSDRSGIIKCHLHACMHGCIYVQSSWEPGQNYEIS